MKTRNILTVVITSLFCMTSCMDDDWDGPDMRTPLYGNNDIVEMNVISIAELKTKYASNISGNTASDEIIEDIQVKGRITGNDIGGNIYKQIVVQDNTGAIVIGINKGSLYTYLPIGQAIIIDLKGLRVGGYGKQAQIGSLYNSGMGRVDDDIWQKHVKLLGEADASRITPVDFDSSWDKDAKSGQLVTLKGVTISGDGTQTLAPDDGSVPLTSNCANRKINGSSNLVLRTSSYADFACLPIPAGKVNITGIATRYNDTWQILMRSEKDFEVVTK